MVEWLSAAIPAEGELPTVALVGYLVRNAVLGGAVALIYYLTQRKGRAEAAPFVATLVLLTILIGMVTRVIGDNVARAFSLAGALSIIRFRTVVDDTRDTAFVIAAVVTGMAAGAGMLAIALAGLPVLAVVSGLLMVWGGGYAARGPSGTLVVRVGIAPDPAAVLAAPLGAYLAHTKLVSAGTAKQGAAIELKYTAALKPGTTVVGLVTELNRVAGVQGVEWTENGGGR